MHYQHLILFCIIAATLAANEKPRFKFSETNKIMLSWEETWEVGSSNMLAFLNTDKRLIIKIVVVGNVGTGLRRILQFKCRRDYVESMMDMESLKSSSNEVQCKDTIPFSVRLKNERENEFDFTLLSSKLPYSHAFSDKIELRVRIEHSSGVLESNSLFVWNLDAIGKLNPDGRRFLSAGAEQFLKRMSENMPDTEFDSTQFLDPAMSQIIKEAPEFLKPKINIGAILNFDAGTCESYQISRASLFVNYHSKLDERNQNLLKHIYLDTETDSFNRLMATPVSNVITVPKVSQLESMTLTFNIGKVPPANPSTGLNFTHRCVCDVTVGTADTQKIGMPSYSVQSGSSVFFLSRPLLNSFDISMAKNCSLQSCTASDGAYFQFSLKPQLAAYLKAIGVSVTGYFKIDDDYLDFVKVLNQPDVAKVSYDPDTTKLSFKVNRITKPEVLTELQSRKTLTPIFNFRYKEGTKSPNLVFDKKRYGPRQLVAGKRDCRSDDLCFYSTDFDADTTLQGLMLGLDFKGQPVVGENAATASTSIIVGIILAIVLLLIIAVLIVFLLRRDTGQTYLLDEKERQQGNHPEQEAKEEQFKEYQRPEEGPLKARQMSVGSSISAGSKDDQELEEYGNDDIDCTKFVEDGSFIGDYSTDARRRDAFNAHQMAWSQTFSRLCVLLAALLAVSVAQKSPQFVYSQSNKIMLSWDDVWEVGVSNKLAFLNKDKRLIIRINVGGDTGNSSGTKVLVYRCTESSPPEEVALSSVQSQSNYCPGTMPFTISKVSGKEGIDFYFTLLDSMQTYDNVFSQKIQLYIRVEFPVGTITSNSLFVYNLDAISKSPSSSSNDAIIDSFYKRFLTVPAINFMIQMNTTADPFSYVPFIDQQIVDRIRSAPDFIKAKINIGAILQFDAGDCQNFQSHLVSMFVNYYSKMNENNINLLKHIGLSLDDGRLYYSKYGLTTAISNFFRDRGSPKEIGICTLVSFAGHSQPYFKVDEVKQRISTTIVNYKQMGSRTTECSIVGSGTARSVSIFAGMDYTPLVCPIICDDPNQVFRFYHGNQQIVSNGQSEWTYVQGLKISRTGNVIEFPAELFENDSGEYRCEAGGKSFKFDVKIVSMPQFLTRLHDSDSKIVSGDLPQVVFAIENETLSYNCTVYYTNMDQVDVIPAFHTIGTADQKWKKLDLDQFNQMFSSSVSTVRQSTLKTNETKTLNLTISRVPVSDSSTYLNFTHRFVCDASVSPADAQKVGLPSYNIQSSSNVIFLKRPTILSFNRTSAKPCSEQKCSNKVGGTFEVSLSPDMTRRLAASGVKVFAYFKIDNELLENIHTIHGQDISVSKFYPETNRLLFKILPNAKKEVISILQKYKYLTPVFNFGYKDSSGTKLTNLNLHKERYGQPIVSFGDRDCRADSTCFYSTDFDSADLLADLSIRLGFDWISDEQPAAGLASASAGLIAGITLAALIVLIAIILLVLLLRRDSGQTYLVDEKERQQGNHPELEVKEEHFKEYQPAEEAPMRAERMSLNSYSGVSIKSQDDRELDVYKDDMGDMGDFTEDGSFIGEYSAKKKKRDNSAN
uniref:Bravo_FIGEY domain-containing protein n=1 Tax=Macrostomum lignano TaxID=282301 RepID=A0A1I8GV64_9PLAT